MSLRHEIIYSLRILILLFYECNLVLITYIVIHVPLLAAKVCCALDGSYLMYTPELDSVRLEVCGENEYSLAYQCTIQGMAPGTASVTATAEDGTFKPDAIMNREQVASMVANILAISKVPVVAESIDQYTNVKDSYGVVSGSGHGIQRRVDQRPDRYHTGTGRQRHQGSGCSGSLRAAAEAG